MNNKMPDVSSAFTVDDIHKIREWNYERRKDMSPDEKLADIQRGAAAFLRDATAKPPAQKSM